MSRTGWMMCACALALAVGCGDSRSGEDAGGIVLMDTGPGADAGPVTGTDSGPVASGCSLTSPGMPLPAGCLPRCMMSTVTQLNACSMGDPPPSSMEIATCQQAAVMADTTPGVTLMTPAGNGNLNCQGCFNYQLETCAAEACPTEYEALLTCQMTATDPMTECAAQANAVNTCANGSPGFQSCGNMRAGMCFGATSGFLPSAPRRLERLVLTPAQILGWSFTAR